MIALGLFYLQCDFEVRNRINRDPLLSEKREADSLILFKSSIMASLYMSITTQVAPIFLALANLVNLCHIRSNSSNGCPHCS
jgi:hypothetical protein